MFVLLFLSMSCPETIIVNNTANWADIDKKALTIAQSRCKFYYESSPCLKKFIKREERIYWAICGRPNSIQKK
jgi:hypothetical protein